MYVTRERIVSVTREGEELGSWEHNLFYEPLVRQVPCRPSPDELQIACLNFRGIAIVDTQGNWIAYLRGDEETFGINAFQWSPVVQ